jgi:hypothetical protein
VTDRQDKMTCREGQNDRPLPEITMIWTYLRRFEV